MKNTSKNWIFLILLSMLACTQAPDDTKSTVEETSYVVYTTNNPLFYFTRRIAPKNFDVRFPMRESSDPAYWEVNADSIAIMRNADLIILNGANYEKWLDLVSLPSSSMINSTADIADDLIEGEDAITHSHGPEGEHVHAGMAFTTWLDLEAGIAQARAVRDALIRLDSTKSTQIEENFQSLSTDLKGLHQELLETVDSTWMVAFSHPVYQYFQRAYKLEGPSLHWEPDMEFGHSMEHDLEHLLEDSQVKVLIWEKEPSSALRTELQNRGIISVVVDPAANFSGTGFLDVMRENIRQLEDLQNQLVVSSAGSDRKK